MAAVGMKVTVSLKDTPAFKALLAVVKDMLEDERIPADIREAYWNRLDEALEKSDEEEEE